MVPLELRTIASNCLIRLSSGPGTLLALQLKLYNESDHRAHPGFGPRFYICHMVSFIEDSPATNGHKTYKNEQCMCASGVRSCASRAYAPRHLSTVACPLNFEECSEKSRDSDSLHLTVFPCRPVESRIEQF